MVRPDAHTPRPLVVTDGDSFQLFLPALVGTIGAMPDGYAADRRGKKPVLAGGVLAFSVVAFVGSQVATVPQALVAMALVALANGVWTALAMPLLIDLVPPGRAGEIVGVGSAVWSLSQPVGAIMAGLLSDGFGTFRISFVGAAVFVLLSFLALVTLRAPLPVCAQRREPLPDLGPL